MGKECAAGIVFHMDKAPLDLEKYTFLKYLRQEKKTKFPVLHIITSMDEGLF